MPFTNKGYEVRRFRDILEEIRSGLEAGLGTPISSDPDNVLGITNSIFTNEVARVENNIQALVQNISIFTAEGRFLDELVRYLGITRRGAQPANGSLKVWRNGQGTIPTSVRFSNSFGNEFIITGGLTHSLDSCAEVSLGVGTVAENDVFTLQVNTIEFTYTAGASDTATDVVDYFVTQIFNQLGLTTENNSDILKIVGENEDLNSLSIVIEEGFTISEIAVFGFCESVQTGELVVPENTITTIVTNNPALLRCNNPLAFENGTDEETDEELRARHQRSIQVGGNATVPSIVARLLQLANVTQAYIIENRTLTTDGEGRPPKSYETFVVGGDPTVIGQAIWDSKPAGVETYGDISTIITDNVGVQHSVNWSRPENVYIFLRITYKLYDEEVFPIEGEDVIAQAVVDYGEELPIGKDVVPTRFIGSIYNAVDGVDTVLVEVGFSTDIGDTSPPLGYGTDTIPIAQSQVAQFTLSRVTLVQDI
jgi:uncharacterized phage protein gp47/JayE